MVTDTEIKQKGRHRPPSRIRYEKANPPVTIRLTKSLRTTIDEMRGVLSYSQFIKNFLKETAEKVNAVAVREAYDRGLNEGFRRGQQHFEITIPCSKCGNPMTVIPGEVLHNDIKEKYKNWHHIECP